MQCGHEARNGFAAYDGVYRISESEEGMMKMEMIMMSINESWVWLGPLLVICFGTELIAQVIDIFTAEDVESAEVN